jgi:hypothetical protein
MNVIQEIDTFRNENGDSPVVSRKPTNKKELNAEEHFLEQN